MSELYLGQNCPFCNGEAVPVKSVCELDDSVGYRMRCVKCHSEGPASDSVEGSVENWNNRTSQNREVIHDIKNKMSPVKTLVYMACMRFDQPNDDVDEEVLERYERMIKNLAKQSDTNMVDIVKLLDEVK